MKINVIIIDKKGKDNLYAGLIEHYKKIAKPFAKVEVIEPLGAEIHLYVSTENHQMIIRTPPKHEFQVEEQIVLTPDMEKLHFFDMETENFIG